MKIDVDENTKIMFHIQGKEPIELKSIEVPHSRELEDKIIEMRVKKGWTQELLSEYSGVALKSIKEFENGERVMSFPIFRVLHKTIIRLRTTIDEYNKLSHKDKIQFQRYFNLKKCNKNFHNDDINLKGLIK